MSGGIFKKKSVRNNEDGNRGAPKVSCGFSCHYKKISLTSSQIDLITSIESYNNRV